MLLTGNWGSFKQRLSQRTYVHLIVNRMQFNKTKWSYPWNSNQNGAQNSAKEYGVSLRSSGVGVLEVLGVCVWGGRGIGSRVCRLVWGLGDSERCIGCRNPRSMGCKRSGLSCGWGRYSVCRGLGGVVWCGGLGLLGVWSVRV